MSDHQTKKISVMSDPREYALKRGEDGSEKGECAEVDETLSSKEVILDMEDPI
jgi:hypothetical protein